MFCEFYYIYLINIGKANGFSEKDLYTESITLRGTEQLQPLLCYIVSFEYLSRPLGKNFQM